MFLGGVLAFADSLYSTMTTRFNRRFDTHIPTTKVILYYDPGMDPIHVSKPRRIFPYTAVAYILSSEAARILVSLVDKYGFVQPADHMVDKLMDLTGTSYTAHPLLVVLPKPTKAVDHADESDIQRNFYRIINAPPMENPPFWPNLTHVHAALSAELPVATHTPEHVNKFQLKEVMKQQELEKELVVMKTVLRMCHRLQAISQQITKTAQERSNQREDL